jgi:hypothetical protein
LLKPDVASFPVGEFLSAWLTENSSALDEMSGKKRIRFAIKRLLGMQAPRHTLTEMVNALCQSVSQPLVLVLPPNGELINWANQQANQGEPAKISELDVDSVSVYLADFLRIFAGLNVAGVVVQLPDETSVNPELLALYSPIINVAKHYDWAFGIQVNAPVELNDSDSVLDMVLSDHANANSGMLDEEFWDGSRVKTDSGFYFGKVDPDLTPEIVLSRLASLK